MCSVLRAYLVSDDLAKSHTTANASVQMTTSALQLQIKTHAVKELPIARKSPLLNLVLFPFLYRITLLL